MHDGDPLLRAVIDDPGDDAVRQLRPLIEAHGYFATQDGRVFTDRVSTRHRKGGIRELKQSISKTGHRYIRAVVGGRSVALYVHRIVANAFLSPPAEGQAVVRHLDGDPANNVVGNLAWGTQAENMADCVRHGRTLKGTKNPNAKLTPQKVRIIRGMCREGLTRQSVATFFGVSPGAVSRVVLGDTWECVGEN